MPTAATTAKEEEFLFPLLESKGLARGGGPIDVMLSEHEEGRSLVREMAEAAASYAGGSEEAGRRWAGAAWRYAALLRQHIQKENNVLFVMAETLLTDVDHSELITSFAKFEDEKMGSGTHERLHAMMDKLEADVRKV